jgi:two-component system LytT family sensor kinase
MIRKANTPLIRLNKKTAFLSALFLNLFFFLVQLVVVVYSYHMGENVGEQFIERIVESGRHVKPINLILEPIIWFMVNTLMVYFFLRVEFWIVKNFQNEKKKTVLYLFVFFFFVAGLSTAISQLLGIWFKGDLTAYQYSIIHFVKDLVLFITSIFCTYLLYLIIKNQERIEENKNLVIENFKNRYEALKNKTDPHFLFNSLNSLSGLIGYDDERAQEYLMQLSSVFRYTIQENSVVTLSEELSFTESYIYLMKIRYGEGFTVNVDIPEKYQTYHILPFAIQTLVENTVKHNVASLHKPLKISIRITDSDELAVENNLQPRKDVIHGNGMGLSNLNERYLLMFGQRIHIQTGTSFFRVEIPLIKNLGKYSDKLID